MSKIATALFSVLCAATVFAQGGLKTINGPQGGKIAYGRVDGQTTEAGALGAMLHSLHQQYGDRPQVSKLFQVKGTQSVAAFFSVTKRTQGNGQLAGMVIVTKVANDQVEAAVLSNDAAHFGSTYNPMMKTLMSSWHPFASVPAAAGSNLAGVPLHKFTTQDRTASVDLPDGWKVEQGSGGGTIFAGGPNGERATLGFGFLAYDLNNPNVRHNYQIVQQGGFRNTAVANGIYYALGGDMAKTLVDLVRMYRQKNNQPPNPFQLKSETPVQGPPGQRCAHIVGISDPQDAKKAMELNTVFCTSTPTRAAGIYMAIITSTAIPTALADKERATMGVSLASFWVDTAAVQRMAHQYAAPAIEAIHAIGRAAAAQAAAAHARNDAWNSSVYKRWDDNDKRSQEFGNYLLGYSVIRDVDNNYHGTFWNEDAELLVHSYPNTFEYVSAPDFWKGIDY
jgi:hypothetical protein